MDNDKFYYKKFKETEKNSPCHSRKVVAILVNSNNQIIGSNLIIGMGWNAPLNSEMICKNSCYKRSLGYKSGEGFEVCPAIHAEVRCIASAAYRGEATAGGTLYISTCIPCKHCLRLIIMAGISEIVCEEYEFYDEESKLIVEAHKEDLKIRTFNIEEVE